MIRARLCGCGVKYTTSTSRCFAHAVLLVCHKFDCIISRAINTSAQHYSKIVINLKSSNFRLSHFMIVNPDFIHSTCGWHKRNSLIIPRLVPKQIDLDCTIRDIPKDRNCFSMSTQIYNSKALFKSHKTF